MSKRGERGYFMEKLRFHLSFHFSDAESISILRDYEEWFENEISQGKSGAEVCHALGDPRKIVKNLLVESGSHPNKADFIQNKMLQTLLFMTVYMFAGIGLLIVCNRNALNFFYIAVGMIFLYFLMGSVLAGESVLPVKKQHYRINIFVAGVAALILGFEIFLRQNMSLYSGKTYVIGAEGLIVFFFCINLYIVISKTLQDSVYTWITTFHIWGVIMLLFFSINQMHMLYDDITRYTGFLYSSVCIYTGTVALCCVFYGMKNYVREQI